MEPYLKSGYKTDRARDQAKAFKTPFPSGAFVAPGFPVEVAPPPPPPPIVPIVVGGAAAGAALPLAVLGGVAAGLALGLDVKRDIDRFKKNAKLPFYDADNLFTGGSGWKTNPHWDQSKQVMWDQRADDLYKDHLYDLLQTYRAPSNEGYWWKFDPVPGLPAEFYAADGLHGPVYQDGTVFRFWRIDPGIGCAGSRERWKWIGQGINLVSGFPEPCPVATPAGFVSSLCIDGLPRGGTGGPNWVCPTNPDVFALEMRTMRNTGTSTQRLVERWVLDSLAAPGSQALAEVVPEGVGTITRPIAAPWILAGVGHATPWADAVAAPFSQPSYDEQQRGVELPRGDDRRGYWVPIPINYPFTRIDVAPGSPPVTVPDVVIDPAVGVVLVPPGGPLDYPTDVENFERKPKSRSAAGIVMSIATEAQDFVHAMHKGLPKKYRRKGRWGVQPDADIVLRDIIDHWDEWDADVALEAFVNNQIEDEILGKYYFGSISKRSRSGKYGFGVRGVGAGAGYIPIPVVHFSNGQHSISMGEHSIDLVNLSAH